MAKRSLKASEAGQIQAKQAFERTGWTQEHLATQVGLGTRQSVWKFFTGRPVDRSIFVDLCFQLDLDWEEIVDTPIAKPKEKSASTPIATLKKQFKDRLREGLSQSTMPFDICQPLPLPQIYTPQFFLPSISSQHWFELHELNSIPRGQHTLDTPSILNRAATQLAQNAQKLVILGNPGAGKTTFLHHVVHQCLEDTLFPDHIPLFISLRGLMVQYPDHQFPTLENYIETQFLNPLGTNFSSKNLLADGHCLLLLDGLDEVSSEARTALCQTIQSWAQRYPKNRFILTCRIAAQQFRFQGFTYSELAEFNPEQIEQFVHNFFTLVSPQSGAQKARNFLEQLYRKPNQPIRDLVTTPILLNLVCSIFQARKTFPSNRAKLYQAALEVLIDRWDMARGIQRDLSLPMSKVERFKLLSHLAAQTFEQEQLFFDQQKLLHIISEYWQTNQPASGLDTEQLWDQGSQMIRSIASQNGLLVERAKDIYSFSHLTFHEYLTARHIVAASTGENSDHRLDALAAKVSQDHWREVIFLAVNLLPKPLDFLERLQAQSLKLIADYPQIHRFLKMIQQKTETLNHAYPRWALRTFYFSMLINANLKLTFAIEPLLANPLAPDFSLDHSLIRLLNAMEQVRDNPSMSHLMTLHSAFKFETQYSLSPEFRAAFQSLKSELPTGDRCSQDWWQQEGKAWIARWQQTIETHRGLSIDWQWSPEEAAALQSYYQATQLLVDCLQFEARLTTPERESIINQLLISSSGSEQGV